MVHHDIVAPHLNAEVYRSNNPHRKKGTFQDYFRVHNDGHIMVGSSELTGRFWNGDVTIYKDIEEANTDQQKKSITLKSGSGAGCFIEKSNKVLVGEDNGTVSIWTYSSSEVWQDWTEVISVAEHDSAIHDVACIEPEKRYLSVDGEGYMKIWDISEMIAVKQYDRCHSLQINAVAMRPNSNKEFVTCSMDQYVYMWGEEKLQPIVELVENDCGIRCFTWIDENLGVFGDEAGMVKFVDARIPNKFTKVIQFSAPVHMMALNSTKDKLAICCDSKTLTVCEWKGGQPCPIVYKDQLDSDTDYLRGVAWDPVQENIVHAMSRRGIFKSHTIA